MKKWLFALCVALVSAFSLWPRSYEATAKLTKGPKITMSISPMFGIHSDWKRKIFVEYSGKRIAKELMSDTGWWRGSNLYRHTSGAYVIHEGQGWCFSFTFEPLEFDNTPEVSCVKNSIIRATSDNISPYYRDMSYLGLFMESSRLSDEQRIYFTGADQTLEHELPDGP
ncbi:hypothetical protein AB9F26_11535 [Falsihalocynthiibacter sp. BN13B15]|uniref:hypothetical protein n=1 Tax=Falsihalocynthiibacter sp. BN13B15 TaxID=3240871 RepID=UPI00350EAE4D